VKGGFSTVYDVLKAMEDGGRVRRGLFVAGLGATQFALPGALDQLRAVRDEQDVPQVVHLSAVDPANPYGSLLRWPSRPEDAQEGRGPSRTIGATVILVNGRLAAWLARGERQLLVYLSDDERTKTMTARAVAERLYAIATAPDSARKGMLIGEVDGCPTEAHPIAPFLIDAGFVRGAMGYQASARFVGSRSSKSEPLEPVEPV
jgi:ATP-dependent Lhr-like helicase